MAPPALQFSSVGPIGISGSGAPDKNSILRTLSSLISTHSLCWQIDTSDVTGSTLQALVVKPTTSSGTPNMRIIFAGDFTQPNSGSFMAKYTAGGAIDDATSGHIMIGLAPNINEYGSGTYVAGRWDGPAPFGTNPRWSKYWSMGTRAGMTHIGIIESTETLFVYMKNSGAGTGTTFGGYAGAIISGFDTQTSENGRVYGMITTGGTSINSAFWATQLNFMGQYEVANDSHAGCFITSGSYASNEWDLITHLFSMSENAGFPGSTGSPGSTIIGQPITMISTITPKSIGYMRQVYMHQDSFSVPVSLIVSGANSSNGQIVAVAFSPTNNAVSDTVLFGSTGSL